ncbi:MAG: hypothetical protein NDI61_08930 [Bdellovibrionaceae bacterium]|nr:hypothetical protein [Pseudobdellovibrionaceae bacterium]
MEPITVLSNLTKSWRPADRKAAAVEAEAEDRAAIPSTRSHLHISRHDDHNIEVKAIFEFGARAFEGEIEAFLFIPRSFDLRSWGKSDLEKDVRSRVRLAVPVGGEQGLAAVANSKAALKQMLAAARDRNETPSEDAILEAARDLCAVTAETLKQWMGAQTRALAQAHMPFANAEESLQELVSLRDSVGRASELINEIRAVVAEPASGASVLRALDEYLSHLYVQYLGALHSELSKHSGGPPALDAHSYRAARTGLQTELSQRMEREAIYRLQAGWCSDAMESDVERERRLVRMSHLKKFFQSRNFVDVSRRPSAKRVSETTALAGTAFAGLIWALLQRFNRPDVVDVAFQSFFIVGFAVVAYVLRDRLKDWAKERFHEEARKFLADYEQVLMARDRRIGEVKEWFHIRDANTLTDEIRALRRRAAGYEMELRLPEDVFHYRKRQDIESFSEGPWAARALHENLRLNFERYLKHMDDPFKELIDFDPEGRLHSHRSHRVYHFYLCVRTSRRTPAAERGHAPMVETTQTTFHRVVLDKNGIVRLENGLD